MAYCELTDGQFAEWQKRQPRPQDGCWSPDRWREIEDAVRDPWSPYKWFEARGLFRMESRAWLEWNRARGRLRYRDDPRRPNTPQWMRAKVIERDGFRCGICSGEVASDDVHIDHVYPVSLGGETALDNLRVTHSLCNIKKGARV